ncbi:hypothetical protein V8C34DRAFT_304607 [Trichoderma compactum]
MSIIITPPKVAAPEPKSKAKPKHKAKAPAGRVSNKQTAIASFKTQLHIHRTTSSSTERSAVRAGKCQPCTNGNHTCPPCHPLMVPFVRRMARAAGESDKKAMDQCRAALRLLLEMIEDNDSALEPLEEDKDDDDDDDDGDDGIVTRKQARKAWRAVAEYIFD